MADKQLINKLETSCLLVPQRSAEGICDVLNEEMQIAKSLNAWPGEMKCERN